MLTFSKEYRTVIKEISVKLDIPLPTVDKRFRNQYCVKCGFEEPEKARNIEGFIFYLCDDCMKRFNPRKR